VAAAGKRCVNIALKISNSDTQSASPSAAKRQNRQLEILHPCLPKGSRILFSALAPE